MLFISPKQKITILEMILKSSITSKLDQEMELKLPNHFWRLLENLTGWKREYLIAQLRTWIWQQVFKAQNMFSRCTSSPVGKMMILHFYQFLFCLAGLSENYPLQSRTLHKEFGIFWNSAWVKPHQWSPQELRAKRIDFGSSNCFYGPYSEPIYWRIHIGNWFALSVVHFRSQSLSSQWFMPLFLRHNQPTR